MSQGPSMAHNDPHSMTLLLGKGTVFCTNFDQSPALSLILLKCWELTFDAADIKSTSTKTQWMQWMQGMQKFMLRLCTHETNCACFFNGAPPKRSIIIAPHQLVRACKKVIRLTWVMKALMVQIIHEILLHVLSGLILHKCFLSTQQQVA